MLTRWVEWCGGLGGVPEMRIGVGVQGKSRCQTTRKSSKLCGWYRIIRVWVTKWCPLGDRLHATSSWNKKRNSSWKPWTPRNKVVPMAVSKWTIRAMNKVNFAMCLRACKNLRILARNLAKTTSAIISSLVGRRYLWGGVFMSRQVTRQPMILAPRLLRLIIFNLLESTLSPRSTKMSSLQLKKAQSKLKNALLKLTKHPKTARNQWYWMNRKIQMNHSSWVCN